MNTDLLVLERTYPASVATLWKAWTDAGEMKKWYFNLPGFKPVAGYEFQFMGGPPDGIQYRHLCKITEVIPGKKLSHTWAYEGYPGSTLLTIELFPDGANTRIKLTHSGLHSFPKDVPDLAPANFVAGWTSILDEGLKNYLNN
jgi:uncharacterized protein YndB with AHSA1/START domain